MNYYFHIVKRVPIRDNNPACTKTGLLKSIVSCTSEVTNVNELINITSCQGAYSAYSVTAVLLTNIL